MNQVSWKQKKDKLCLLIKQLSDHYAGDDIDWLRSYAQDVIAQYHDNLDEAITCFQDLVDNRVKFVIK